MFGFVWQLPTMFVSDAKTKAGELSAKQRALLERLGGARDLGDGLFQIEVAGQVTFDFTTNLPGLFNAEKDELIIKRFVSHDQGKGHLKGAFDLVCDAANEEGMHLLVDFEQLDVRHYENLDMDKLSHFLTAKTAFSRTVSLNQFIFVPERPRNESWVHKLY